MPFNCVLDVTDTGSYCASKEESAGPRRSAVRMCAGCH